MRVLRDHFREVLDGIDYREVRSERAILRSDPLRERLEGIVDNLIAGKLTKVAVLKKSPRSPTAFDLERLEINEHKSEKVEGSRRRRHSHRREPLARKHVLAAKLYERDRATKETHDEEGEPVAPFVSIILIDGSRIEVPFDGTIQPTAAGA